jgi:hypothetical protein
MRAPVGALPLELFRMRLDTNRCRAEGAYRRRADELFAARLDEGVVGVARGKRSPGMVQRVGARPPGLRPRTCTSRVQIYSL